MRPVKNFLLFLVLVLLGISALQKLTGLIPEKPLDGFSIFRENPTLKFFTWQRWFSSEFQTKTSDNLEDHVGFRSSLIRSINQVNYSLFGITNAPGWIAGRNGFLFEEDYIHEYNGNFFVGTAAIDKKMQRLKDVRDSLAAHHIPLVIVYESGKASLYPDYIPRRFLTAGRTMSNADYLLAQADRLALPVLNIDRYFKQIRDTCRYLLFPRYGMHWSMYGTHLVADTLCRYIEKTCGKPMPVFPIHHMHHSANSLWAENDIGELFNLLWPLKPTPTVYPMVSFRKIPCGTGKAIIVADSYYNLIVETYGIKMFGKQDFWYYNKKMYPYQNNNPPTYVDKTNLRDQLLSHDMILLMVSEINMHCLFWNFADEAYLAFHPEAKDPQVYNTQNTIRDDREWFHAVVKKSRTEKRPLEEVIRGDADYMFYENYQKIEGKNYWDTIEYITINIRRDENWFAAVKKKAFDRKMPVDSMIMRDAVYLYDESKKKH